MARWDGKERRQDRREPTDRLILEVPFETNLDRVLRLFITTLGSGLHAIALALSTNEDNSAEIREQADKVRAVREKLQTSVSNQQKGD